MSVGKIIKISGPLIVAEGMQDCKMYDVVEVSKQKLIGEIIELRGDKASIQVYEDTSMIGCGEDVYPTDEPLSVELGPGLIGSMFDGIQRPLKKMLETSGERIGRGVHVNALDRKAKYKFKAKAKKGDKVTPGCVLGEVQENELVVCKILVPNGIEGEITEIKEGEYTVDQTIAKIKDDKKTHNVTMMQKWPVRIGRPYKQKLTPDTPMITGQRVIDTFFPIAKGGVAAVPGPFGSGKTIVQHQLAKWADADIIIYIGCGERGNEMTDVLNEFPQLIDPKSGQPLMKRTVLIANTSDMPVAAREASIYTGITIAEYYRDMGYSVAIMADSTSRWAEALREMSGRLEEMPGEEGYPAYLSSRLAEFYERAGIVKVLGENKKGSITAIGAVSPPGGDLSEPVSQATLRIVKVFWGLSSALAYRRHFPAIDWLISYSLYQDNLSKWYEKNISDEWIENKVEAMRILQEEAKLSEIVRLVGVDALSARDRLTMETAKSIREDYLHQNAFHEIDTFASLKKQDLMLKLILQFQRESLKAIDHNVDIEDILAIETKDLIGRVKYIEEKQLSEIENNIEKLTDEIKCLYNQEI